eukprot:c17534_g1_i1.p1 GENE.c17534_g1_i1~~c17534_g1_i1.p1  ORF type:complete len:240 (-),score=92.84 c17534_g1_i1:38-757(-)
MSFTCSVLGGSGMVGGSVVRSLLADKNCSKIVLIGRREIPNYVGNNRIEQHIVSMDKLRSESERILSQSPTDISIITLGIGPIKGVSIEEIEKVELTYTTEFGIAAKNSGVRHLSILTSVGSDPNSTGFMGGFAENLVIKGKFEQNMIAQKFPSLSIFRPATIMGNPHNSFLLNAFAKTFRLVLPSKYKDVQLEDLGLAMVHAPRQQLAKTQDPSNPSVSIYEGDTLFNLIANAKNERQ